MRISDWSSDVCSSDLLEAAFQHCDPLRPCGLGIGLAWRGLAGELPACQRREKVQMRAISVERRDVTQGRAACALKLLGVTLRDLRSEEHTSELQSLMRISYAVFCLKKKKHPQNNS